MIQVENLTKYYGDLAAIKDVSPIVAMTQPIFM
jgi:hypothetical protein